MASQFSRGSVSLMEDLDDILYAPTNRGGFHLHDKNGYKYFKSTTQPAKDCCCCWSCLEKKELRCDVTDVTVLSTKKLIKLSGEHCMETNWGGSPYHGEGTVDDCSHDAYCGTGMVLGERATNQANHFEGSISFMRSSQASARDLQRKILKLKGYLMNTRVL
jgi:hypothetical protein